MPAWTAQHAGTGSLYELRPLGQAGVGTRTSTHERERRRMGVEPTDDRAGGRPDGFEDRGAHRGPSASPC